MNQQWAPAWIKAVHSRRFCCVARWITAPTPITWYYFFGVEKQKNRNGFYSRKSYNEFSTVAVSRKILFIFCVSFAILKANVVPCVLGTTLLRERYARLPASLFSVHVYLFIKSIAALFICMLRESFSRLLSDITCTQKFIRSFPLKHYCSIILTIFLT